MKIEILWEDDMLLVCYKPAGMAVQTSKLGEEDCVSELRNYIASTQGTTPGKPPYIGLINRLDQPVEGILLLAKTEVAAKLLSEQIAKRNMDKCYYAVVQGRPKIETGTLINYVIKNGKSNQSQVVDTKIQGAKRAELYYETLVAGDEESLLRINLKTGRHHQIRVQMAHADMPLLGDVKYGAKAAKGIALCAFQLEFKHPKTGKNMDFKIQPKGILFLPYIGKL